MGIEYCAVCFGFVSLACRSFHLIFVIPALLLDAIYENSTGIYWIYEIESHKLAAFSALALMEFRVEKKKTNGQGQVLTAHTPPG